MIYYLLQGPLSRLSPPAPHHPSSAYVRSLNARCSALVIRNICEFIFANSRIFRFIILRCMKTKVQCIFKEIQGGTKMKIFIYKTKALRELGLAGITPSHAFATKPLTLILAWGGGLDWTNLKYFKNPPIFTNALCKLIN